MDQACTRGAGFIVRLFLTNGVVQLRGKGARLINQRHINPVLLRRREGEP